ncbi:MAG: Ldh family oxidoreductase, partial [Pseudomonadota bacterium]
DAEAEGIRNVGLGYIHLYLKHLACGKVAGHAVPETIRTSASATVVDAGHGFCHTAYLHGEARLIECAQREGIGVLAITNSYSAGVLGWFVRRLAQRGLVAMMFANSSKAVAAHGGKVPFFGTNPLAFAAPRGDDEPVVVDMATASTARVNIVRAAREGVPIDAGHAIDDQGEPTTDAAAALRGAQLPMAGAKGFGLGLMVDILGGLITGGNCSYEASLFSDNEGGPPNVGQSIIALDPGFYAAGFVDHLEQMLADMKSGNSVRVPGERRAELRQHHTLNGVEVPDELLAQIAALSP